MSRSTSRRSRGPAFVVRGRRLVVEPDDRDDIVYHLAGNGASVEEMAAFLGAARDARRLFDVGAYKALFAHLFCLTHPESRAVAWEPSPVLAEKARRIGRLSGTAERVTVREAAVGDRAAVVPGSVAADGFIRFDRPPGAATLVDIPVVTLDEEVDALGVVPDLVKIDVEGWEHEALRVARGLLRRHRPTLFLELHLDMLEARGIPPAEVVAELEAAGYGLRACDGRRLRPKEVSGAAEAILRVVAS